MKIVMSAKIAGSWAPLQKTAVNRIDAAVRKVAFDVTAMAQDKAPIITGALMNSIYPVTSKGSGYARSAAAAAAAVAKAGEPPRSMFPAVPPVRVGEAIVAVGMEYGYDVEYGDGRREPKPYLTPAVEQLRPALARAVALALVAP